MLCRGMTGGDPLLEGFVEHDRPEVPHWFVERMWVAISLELEWIPELGPL